MRLSTPPKLPTLRTPAVKPTGPRFIPKIEEVMGGPGQSPAGFVTGKNSETEWSAYWALAKIFKNPIDPRVPPFYGGSPDWAYQFEQGTVMGIRGDTNIDFVIFQGGTVLGIRVQSERYHVFVDARKHAYDALQEATLESTGITVVNVYEEELLADPSGQKAIVTMKRMIGRIEKVNPVIAGTAIRASRLRVIG